MYRSIKTRNQRETVHLEKFAVSNLYTWVFLIYNIPVVTDFTYCSTVVFAQSKADIIHFINEYLGFFYVYWTNCCSLVVESSRLTVLAILTLYTRLFIAQCVCVFHVLYWRRWHNYVGLSTSVEVIGNLSWQYNSRWYFTLILVCGYLTENWHECAHLYTSLPVKSLQIWTILTMRKE